MPRMVMRHSISVLAASVLLTGCSMFSCSGSEASHTPKDTIVIGWESDARSLDPRYAEDANAQYIENLIHCSLVGFDAEGKLVADLAQETPHWLSPTELEVKIKPGVFFSDKSLLTAEDVKATYEFFLDEKLSSFSARAEAFAKLAKVEVKDPTTLHFVLKEPDASFVTNLVVGVMPIHQAKGARIVNPNESLGCGPYRLEQAETGSLHLVTNSIYSLGPSPRTPKLVFKTIKDEKTRFTKLRKGEIDLVQNVLSRDVLQDVGRKYPYLSAQKLPALATTYIGFNFKDRLAGNIAVRQAIAHALDRTQMIQYVLAGLATPATSLLTPKDPYLKPGLTVPEFDIEKANRILDDAGLNKLEGKDYRFALAYKTTTDITRINIARAIGSQLKKIGIRLNVETVDWGRFKDYVDRGEIQLWGLSWIGFKDPDIFRYAFGSDSLPPEGANRGWFHNEALDRLLQEGRTTTDSEQRRLIYHQVENIVAEQLPYIFLWHEENFVVHHKDVKGFELYADGRLSALARTYK